MKVEKMKLTYSKNIQFTRLLKVQGRLKEFNFRKPNHKPDSLFTVDVIDDYGARIIFHMKNEGEGWKIREDELPEWVREKEGDYNTIILEELSQAN
jgi:hypothetical protein